MRVLRKISNVVGAVAGRSVKAGERGGLTSVNKVTPKTLRGGRNGSRCETAALERRCLLSVVWASTADGFVDSVGAGLGSAGGASYADLASYGFRHSRSGITLAGNHAGHVADLTNVYNQYGISFSLWSNQNPDGATLVSWAKQYPAGLIDQIEGTNEADNTAPGFEGGIGDAAAQARQPEYYNALKGDPATSNIPVALFTEVFNDWKGWTTSSADLSNLHSYPGKLGPAVPLFDDFYDKRNRGDSPLAGQKPIVATETGYTTRPGDSRQVTETARVKYLPRLVMNYFSEGIARTYLFSFTNEEEFGLFNRPGGIAVRDLLQTLKEGTWNTTTKKWDVPQFTPGALDFTLTGQTNDVRTVLLQKSNGDFYLALWREISSFDQNSNTDTNNAAASVTLNLKTPVNSGATVYTYNIGTGSLGSAGVTVSGGAGSQTLGLNVPDSIMLVKLTPSSSSFGSTGGVVQDVYIPAGSGNVSSVPQAGVPTQSNFITSLQSGDLAESWGDRTRGYIVPPTTGLYRFWSSGDDEVQFYLSRWNDPNSSGVLVANNPGWTNVGQWDKYSSQRGAQYFLQAGKKYAFEVVHSDGGGPGHWAIAWNKPGSTSPGPDEIVPGSALSLFSPKGNIGDGSAESPRFRNGEYRYNQSTLPWKFNSGGGMSANNSAFAQSPAPDGAQAFFLQNSGAMQQSAVLDAGTYKISYLGAQRPGNAQTIRVTAGSTVVDTWTPPSSGYTSHDTGTFTVTSNNTPVSIVLAGLNTSGDNTAFVDGITIVKVVSNGPVAISTLRSTGLSSSGSPLGDGQVDPNWTITAGPNGAQSAFATNNAYPVGTAWIANSSTSRWISPRADEAAGDSPGTYTYRTTFSLSGYDASTASIQIRVAVDDNLTNVYLNGVALNKTAAGFSGFTDLGSVSSGFTSGTNTLDFVMVNGNSSANPSGLRVELSGTAVPTGSATLFSDNFDSGSLSNWSPTTNASVSGGSLTLGQNETFRTNVAGAGSWTNYSFSADVKINSQAAGLAFRSVDDNNYYMWQLSSSGNLVPHRKVGGAWTILKQVPLGLSVGTTYSIRIEAIGSTIRTFLNGSLVDTTTDTTFSSGRIGFREALNESGTFDNVLVTSA